ncbi:LAFE_0E07910g1_1 [Lachancea fermentati]|uniref:LAFE_0E07910g1_1 n=1 Tax=Lachancea fermentati TaxID=4955 RepID=A0A1G4MDB8_LACFM|nr:LAFE_0E07910g1_1 [Lachancea fermentati]
MHQTYARWDANGGAGGRAPPSPHTMIYRRWARPVGRMLAVCMGSYYALCFGWEWLERSERAQAASGAAARPAA